MEESTSHSKYWSLQADRGRVAWVDLQARGIVASMARHVWYQLIVIPEAAIRRLHWFGQTISLNRNSTKAAVVGVLVALAISDCLSRPAHADVGIVVYGSKGIDARRTESGHIALIVTDLCARGISQVRLCASDEPQGVVITKYPNLASGYDGTVFVVPVSAHFYAVEDKQSLPVLSSGSTLRILQVRYWRAHLKPYLPSLSHECHEALLKEQSTFRAGRAVRELLTLEFLGKVLGARHEHDSGDAVALIDPSTEELIPNGHWREAIGAEHVRSAAIMTVPAEVDQELKLVEFIERSQHEPFNTLSNNCSDFVKKGLLTVFASGGMRFRHRLLDPADAWITSPLFVATSFLDDANKRRLPLSVSFMPILAGTGRPSSAVRSIARGAIVAAPNQGKLAFALKIYIDMLNPLIGTTAFAVDKASGFADVDKLVHENEGISLSRISNDIAGQPSDIESDRRREQVRRFGTSSCWKAKRREFAMLTAQATEIGSLTKVEQSQLLSRGRPFLLPRYYEKLARVQNPDGPLMSGIQASLGSRLDRTPGMGFLMHVLPLVSDEQGEMVPSRLQIRSMAESIGTPDHAIAFRLMISAINYDLASEAKNRRIAAVFDEDWQLFLLVAERAGLRLPSDSVVRENLEECSTREFREGVARVDAIREERAPLHRMFSWFRQLLVSPVR